MPATCRPYGLDLELIERATRCGSASRILTREAVAGSFSPLDGHANPRLAAPAFARAARRAGAAVLEGAEVFAIEKTGEDFRSRRGDGRRFRAPVVQVSAGAWGGRLAERFGEAVPLEAAARRWA